MKYSALNTTLLRGIMVWALIMIQLSVSGQIGFFEDYWTPKEAVIPNAANEPVPVLLPASVITVDAVDTIRKVSPYVGGYNLNTYYGGRMYDKQELMRHMRNLELPFFRYPGGSGSLWYFWNHARPNLPDSVDYLTIKGETFHISEKIRWGDIPGDDYLSLDNSYRLRDSLGTEAIHVVNYALARYGRQQDPVAAAAHYAANWVRYDNGRTRFWELGNEIYGAWEPSWIIDTSRNLDGQPRQITGTLYAEHCLVFLDSMRAAAAETGAEIKIGATLGFKENREQWDREVLQVLGEQVDFYIVHKYFGNDENATPEQVFQSIEDFYQHKAHIDGLIDQYCSGYVPLVLTEWNTRYSGSRQNVSCANGMHTMLGYKAIINEGIGLSGKWNLIWRYQDGDTHGLISGEKDNPAIEGIPHYFPRAPFMYQYFFKKVLGDVSLGNSSGKSGGLDVFSSSFHSGEVGIVMVNTSDSLHNIAINVDNFSHGEHFYWYTLSPDSGAPFDRKVKVNGQTNEVYDAGGPLNYEELQAHSASTSGGVRLELPPYSATYVIVEGSTVSETLDNQVTFKVKSLKDGEVTPLEAAVVKIGENMYLTNENGEVIVPYGTGILNYMLLANGHDTLVSNVGVSGNLTVTDTLRFSRYSVEVELSDAVTGFPLTEGEATLGNQTVTISQEGLATFDEVNFGSYLFEISSKAYKTVIPIVVSSDTAIQLELDKTEYVLTFMVNDVLSGDPLGNAKITFDGDEFYTSLAGDAQYNAIYGVYDLLVEAADFHIFEQQVEIMNDTSISILLSRAIADVKFKVNKGDSPVNNAEVDLNGEVQNTNAIGIVNYYDLPTETEYSFLVNHQDFGQMQGIFTLVTDTTIALDYAQASSDIVVEVSDSKTHLPVNESQVVFNGEFRQSGEDGRVTYSFPAGEYNLLVTRDRYADYTDVVKITGDTLLKVPLDLVSAILKFRVSGNDGMIEGASVDMNSETKTTNSLGMAIFSNISVGEEYDYTVRYQGYNSYSSSLLADRDTTVEVSLYRTQIGYDISEQVAVYPNPARKFMHLQAGFELKYIDIIDMSGREHDVVIHIRDHQAWADIRNLPSGLYLLRVHGRNDISGSVRLVVQGDR